jgi:hypothetical protein
MPNRVVPSIEWFQCAYVDCVNVFGANVPLAADDQVCAPVFSDICYCGAHPSIQTDFEQYNFVISLVWPPILQIDGDTAENWCSKSL